MSKKLEEFEKFGKILEPYLANQGEGDTMVSQIAAAISKIVFKWFNDRDVIDNNNTGLRGWENDLSSYGNWLYIHVVEARPIIYKITKKRNEINGDEGKYEDYLYELCKNVCKKVILSYYATRKKEDSIYKNPPEWKMKCVFVNSDDDEDW